MAKVSAVHSCECGYSNNLEFTKPSHFTPTRLKTICKFCRSTLFHFITKGTVAGQVVINSVVMEPSSKLINVLELADEAWTATIVPPANP